MRQGVRQTSSHKNSNTQSMSSRSMKRQQHCQQRHLRQHQHHHPHDQQPKTQSSKSLRVCMLTRTHVSYCYLQGACVLFSPPPVSFVCRFATCASGNDGGSGSGQTSGCLRIVVLALLARGALLVVVGATAIRTETSYCERRCSY